MKKDLEKVTMNKPELIFTGRKSYYGVEPVVDNQTTFYKIEFPLKNVSGTTEKIPEKVTEKYPEDINSTQKKILDLIADEKTISREEIAGKLGLSLEGIKKNIKQLKDKGIVKRVCLDKGGQWEIVEKDSGQRKGHKGGSGEVVS